MNAKDAEDSALVQQVLNGDNAAFDLIMSRYQTAIYNLTYRMVGNKEDAEDLMQETFLRAYAALHTFRQELRFSSWLYKIAANLCINWKSKRKLFTVSLESKNEEMGVYFPFNGHEMKASSLNFMTPLEDYEAKLLQERLRQEILALPINYRLAFTLRYIDVHTCREIAKIMDIPEGTVKTYLFRARNILKNKLEREWQEFYE
ncbi:sigma-70 family RNA polymerase sigma factor [bacterium]|nr:sigma-70 family RNA polymerase sigma factor [bacterium]